MTGPAPALDLFAILRLIAQSDLEHAATCSICIAEREAEVFAEFGAAVKAKNEQTTLAAAIVRAHDQMQRESVPA